MPYSPTFPLGEADIDSEAYCWTLYTQVFGKARPRSRAGRPRAGATLIESGLGSEPPPDVAPYSLLYFLPTKIGPKSSSQSGHSSLFMSRPSRRKVLPHLPPSLPHYATPTPCCGTEGTVFSASPSPFVRHFNTNYRSLSLLFIDRKSSKISNGVNFLGSIIMRLRAFLLKIRIPTDRRRRGDAGEVSQRVHNLSRAI